MANFSSWKLIFANFSSGNFATIVFLLLHVFSAIYFLHGVHILNLGIEGASVHCTDMLFPFQGRQGNGKRYFLNPIWPTKMQYGSKEGGGLYYQIDKVCRKFFIVNWVLEGRERAPHDLFHPPDISYCMWLYNVHPSSTQKEVHSKNEISIVWAVLVRIFVIKANIYNIYIYIFQFL